MEPITVEAMSYVAAAATLYAFYAKTMVPLRGAAIVANVLFIGYGVSKGAYAILVLHTLLLPLNILRLRAMLRLMSSVQTAAATADFSMTWLRPYMKGRTYPAGVVMFRKGDTAEEAFHLVSGVILLEEVNVRIEPGTFFGEMGLFTTDNKRTVTAFCETPVQVLYLTYDEFRQLYFQQPSFGFYVLRLIVSRMEKNLELARQAAASAGEPVQVGPGCLKPADNLALSSFGARAPDETSRPRADGSPQQERAADDAEARLPFEAVRGCPLPLDVARPPAKAEDER